MIAVCCCSVDEAAVAVISVNDEQQVRASLSDNIAMLCSF